MVPLICSCHRLGFIESLRSTGQARHFSGSERTIEDPYLVEGAREEAIAVRRPLSNVYVDVGRQVVEVVRARVDPIRDAVDVEHGIGDPQVGTLLDDQGGVMPLTVVYQRVASEVSIAMFGSQDTQLDTPGETHPPGGTAPCHHLAISGGF